MQTDGYAGYNQVLARQDIIGVACMAHCRREFVEARPYEPELAEWMLTRVQKLYDIERQARVQNLTFEQRYELRQQCAVPVLEELESWLHEQMRKVLPKSKIGRAIAYVLGQWQRMKRYVTDGRLEIDNNLIENAVRPVALGRKNYLFAGSHNGARRAAVIYTMVANAKIHGLEPWTYLRDVLSRIADYPHKNLADLLPKNWQPAK